MTPASPPLCSNPAKGSHQSPHRHSEQLWAAPRGLRMPRQCLTCSFWPCPHHADTVVVWGLDRRQLRAMMMTQQQAENQPERTRAFKHTSLQFFICGGRKQHKLTLAQSLAQHAPAYARDQQATGPMPSNLRKGARCKGCRAWLLLRFDELVSSMRVGSCPRKKEARNVFFKNRGIC